jgi:hypothetical protein
MGDSRNHLVRLFKESSPSLVMLLVAADGISAILLGILFWLGIRMSDPFPLGADQSADILMANAIALASISYSVFCIMAVMFWRRQYGRRKLALIFLGTAHFATFAYLFLRESSSWWFGVLCGSFITNTLLFVLLRIGGGAPPSAIHGSSS